MPILYTILINRLVTLFPANNPELVEWNDPVFPNVHCKSEILYLIMLESCFYNITESVKGSILNHETLHEHHHGHITKKN